jgi:SH3-like domain-containing protein
MCICRVVVLVCLLTDAFCGVAAADGEQARPVPRFASLASDKVYMREGPTYSHPILWVYRRKGLPVEILAQYDAWRKVRDSGGTEGWVHGSMIAEVRTIVVTSGKPAPVRRLADFRAPILALAQPGVVAKLETCVASACEIDADGTEGWIDKKNIWGVKAGEAFR